ncbi:MAG: hypothetical protein AMJ42_02610 [Deltaproteobacteria bacterium DG_8]|nr:MAG: hypothetical protein AMJ42_02610 [Deltaproteobacteria bacterium DG_8]
MDSVKNKVLFILLDAFRHDYINSVDTPFLYTKTHKGIYAQKLKSVAGFTQRTAIYTGTIGAESGMFTMYTFDAENSPFRFLRDDPRFKKFSLEKHWWDEVLSSRLMERVRNVLDHRLEQKKRTYLNCIKKEVRNYTYHAPLAHIPLELLPEIGVSEDMRPIYLPGAFKEESIFDVFVRHNIEYEYLMYPVVDGDDSTTLEAFINKKDSDAKIILAQFSDSDVKIHHCGPSSPTRHEVTGEIDRKLREIAKHYDDDLSTWIVIGDHGMTDVIEELDVPALLAPLEKRMKVQMGRDYVFFLDSTMARFKWITKAGRAYLSEVTQLPILREKGRFIDEQIAHEHSIPINDRRYGDLIWWAHSGILLFPDYFHDRYTHNKGMHGYDSNHDDMKGFFLAFGSGITHRRLAQISLIDVCPTLCDLLEISYPQQNMGVSIFEK